MKKFLNLFLGFGILFGFYYIAFGIVQLIKIPFPSAIIGLILFALCLKCGLIKEEWIKPTCDLILSNMALFFVPFIVGLTAYQTLLKQNMLFIIIILFVVTTLTIVFTGLFVEYGIKFLRLHKMRKLRDEL